MTDGLVGGILILSAALVLFIILAALDWAWPRAAKLLDRLEAWARRRKP